MGIKQIYNGNVRKLPNEYGDVSVMKTTPVRQRILLQLRIKFKIIMDSEFCQAFVCSVKLLYQFTVGFYDNTGCD